MVKSRITRAKSIKCLRNYRITLIFPFGIFQSTHLIVGIF